MEGTRDIAVESLASISFPGSVFSPSVTVPYFVKELLLRNRSFRTGMLGGVQLNYATLPTIILCPLRLSDEVIFSAFFNDSLLPAGALIDILHLPTY